MAKINLNTWAKEITLEEGLKKSISIAQTKELLKLILKKLKSKPFGDIVELLNRIK